VRSNCYGNFNCCTHHLLVCSLNNHHDLQAAGDAAQQQQAQALDAAAIAWLDGYAGCGIARCGIGYTCCAGKRHCISAPESNSVYNLYGYFANVAYTGINTALPD